MPGLKLIGMAVTVALAPCGTAQGTWGRTGRAGQIGGGDTATSPEMLLLLHARLEQWESLAVKV